ncbi:MAG: hypothetical protein ACLP7O_16610, partial [Terracidiphilus sp.]
GPAYLLGDDCFYGTGRACDYIVQTPQLTEMEFRFSEAGHALVYDLVHIFQARIGQIGDDHVQAAIDAGFRRSFDSGRRGDLRSG